MVHVIKVGLVLAVIAAIVYLVMMSRVENVTEEELVTEIRRNLDSLKKMSDTTFEYRREFYTTVNGNIKTYHKKGYLNEDTSNSLTKEFYNEYVKQFTEQVDAVFSGPDWKDDDLKFIRGECDSLRKPKWFKDLNDLVKVDFAKIQDTIGMYYEIDRFITKCKSAEFPLPDLEDKILQAKEYQNGQYQPAERCARLKNGLEEIPQVFFDKHVKYLNGKINGSLKKYSEYKSLYEYRNELYLPLSGELRDLNNTVYRIDASDFMRTKKDLSEILDNDYRDADKYFRVDLPEIIKKYLNGDELNIDTLEYYKSKEITDYNLRYNLRASIQICLDFWDLDKSYGKTYDDFRYRNNRALNNSVLIGSKLKKYLDCGDSYPSYTDEYKKRMLKKESCD